jgi:hypothetical protein
MNKTAQTIAIILWIGVFTAAHDGDRVEKWNFWGNTVAFADGGQDKNSCSNSPLLVVREKYTFRSPPLPSPLKLTATKMISLLFSIVFWIAALILPSPSWASVESHRAHGQSVGEKKSYSNLIYVHAIFMAITFLFLIPSAIIASRFGRSMMGRKWFAVSLQFPLPRQTEWLIIISGDSCGTQRDSSLFIFYNWWA